GRLGQPVGQLGVQHLTGAHAHGRAGNAVVVGPGGHLPPGQVKVSGAAASATRRTAAPGRRRRASAAATAGEDGPTGRGLPLLVHASAVSTTTAAPATSRN